MIDRVIKLLSWCLGVLLIFLVGFLVAHFNEEAKPSAPAPAPAPRAEADPSKLDQHPNDIPTKRVKTIVVRPEDQSSTPKTP